MTTWSSASNGGGQFAPVASALPRPSRAGALTGHGGRRRATRPASLSMWLLTVRGLRYRAKSDRCGCPSNGAADCFVGQGRRETSCEVSLLFSGGGLSRTNAQCVDGETNQPSLCDPALRQRATDNSRSCQLYR